MSATVEISFKEMISVPQFLDAYFGLVLGLSLDLHEGQIYEMPYQFSAHDWPKRWSPLEDANLLYDLIEKHKIAVKWSIPTSRWFAKDPSGAHMCGCKERAKAEAMCLAMVLSGGPGHKVKIPKAVYDGITKKD